MAGVLWSLTEIPFPAPDLREGSVPTGGDLSCLLGRRCAPLAQYGPCEQMAVRRWRAPRIYSDRGAV